MLTVNALRVKNFILTVLIKLTIYNKTNWICNKINWNMIKVKN